MRRDKIRINGNINAAPRTTATNQLKTVPEKNAYNLPAMLGESSNANLGDAAAAIDAIQSWTQSSDDALSVVTSNTYNHKVRISTWTSSCCRL